MSHAAPLRVLAVAFSLVAMSGAAGASEPASPKRDEGQGVVRYVARASDRYEGSQTTANSLAGIRPAARLLTSPLFIAVSVFGGVASFGLGWLFLLNRKVPDTERELERSAARYRDIFERSPAGNFVTRNDGTLIACNTAFARMLGYASTAEMTAVNARDMYVHPSERDEFLRLLERDGVVESRETALKRADGTTLYALESAVARLDAAGTLVEAEGYLIDVSRQKRAEAALESSEAQLRQAQRMEAMGRLAGGVSHDFNNLLTTILGHAALLLEDEPVDGRCAQLVHIQKAAQSGASLTRQLLAFSRKQVLKPEPLDLNAVVSDVTAMLTRVLGEDIALATELAAQPAYTLADRGQLEQVLMNLAVNARDAMPNGGRLSVVVTLQGHEVHLHVRDTGCGIPAQVLPHIFEPFFTTKGVGSGTGLGLATVYGIVTQSGGRVEVKSLEGMGATFMVRLPRCYSTADTEPTPGVTARPAAKGHETILVVEDDAGVRALIQATLVKRGYTVVLAEDGDIASAMLARSGAAVDLVLSDIVMPRMSGVELTTMLQRTYPNVKIMLMSGYVGYVGSQMSNLPADVTLLQKPFTPESLASGVRKTLDHRAARTGC